MLTNKITNNLLFFFCNFAYCNFKSMVITNYHYLYHLYLLNNNILLKFISILSCA